MENLIGATVKFKNSQGFPSMAIVMGVYIRPSSYKADGFADLKVSSETYLICKEEISVSNHPVYSEEELIQMGRNSKPKKKKEVKNEPVITQSKIIFHHVPAREIVSIEL